MTQPTPSPHPRDKTHPDIVSVATADLPWKKMTGKRVLVTGASGFLGSFLAAVLTSITAKPDVYALARNSRRLQHALGPQFNQVTPIIQDVSQPLPDDLAFDYVIHAASPADANAFQRCPDNVLVANGSGTLNLLAHTARTNTCQSFLYISSSEIYGSMPATHGPITEDDVFQPLPDATPYPLAKRFGEACCTTWFNQHDVPCRIARPFHVYGCGIRPDDPRTFSDLPRRVHQNQPITLHGNGDSKRTYCYLTDAARGIFRILFDGLPNTAYNVGNPDAERSIRDLVDLLLRLRPNSKTRVTTSSAIPIRGNQQMVPDTNRLQALGWFPHVSPETGFQRVLNALATSEDQP